MTPRHAIDIQLRLVQQEIKGTIKVGEGIDTEMFNHLSAINDALEEARKQLEEFETLKTILKRIVT